MNVERRIIASLCKSVRWGTTDTPKANVSKGGETSSVAEAQPPNVGTNSHSGPRPRFTHTVKILKYLVLSFDRNSDPIRAELSQIPEMKLRPAVVFDLDETLLYRT